MSIQTISHKHRSRAWLNTLLALAFLYLFLCAINVMGGGLKGVGNQSDWLKKIIAYGDNPLVAMLGAVLITSIVQSSSFTTSLIITLVAAGQMPIETAVFAIMGASALVTAVLLRRLVEKPALAAKPRLRLSLQGVIGRKRPSPSGVLGDNLLH